MKVPPEVEAKIAELGQKILAGEAIEHQVFEEMARWLLETQPGLAHDIVAEWWAGGGMEAWFQAAWGGTGHDRPRRRYESPGTGRGAGGAAARATRGRRARPYLRGRSADRPPA